MIFVFLRAGSKRADSKKCPVARFSQLELWAMKHTRNTLTRFEAGRWDLPDQELVKSRTSWASKNSSLRTAMSRSCCTPVRMADNSQRWQGRRAERTHRLPAGMQMAQPRRKSVWRVLTKLKNAFPVGRNNRTRRYPSNRSGSCMSTATCIRCPQPLHRHLPRTGSKRETLRQANG